MTSSQPQLCFVGLAIGVLMAGLSAARATTDVLVSDGLNNAVRAYHVTDTNWVYTGVFAAGDYAGAPLTTPAGLAQDAAGNLYVAEAVTNGRVLCFDTNGVYLGALGTNGVQFAGGNAQALVLGPDGNLYLSLAFGTATGNCVYRCDLHTRAWSVFVPNSGAGYSLNTPRGLAFADDGNLYLADRQNNAIRKFSGATGAFLGNLVTATSPQALFWDAVSNRFLMSRTFTGVLESITPGGVVAPVYTQSGSDSFLGVNRVEGRIAFTRYGSGRVDLVANTNAVTPVVKFLNGPSYLLAATLGPRSPVKANGCPDLPGVPIYYSPNNTGRYLGSPALVILPNGDYLASHDYFGGGSSQTTLGQTFLYRSPDRGTNWSRLGQINEMVAGAADDDGTFWNHFLQINGALYSLGNANSSATGYMVIRRSTDNGATWTSVSDGPDNTGRLFAGQMWGPGHDYVLKHGRVWLAAERSHGSAFGDNFIAAISAPTNSDLLAPTNWALSSTVVRDTNWLGGTFRGWLEGNTVEDPLGGLVLVMRVDNRYPNGAAIGGKAAVIRVQYNAGTGAATTAFSGGDFDPTDPSSSGFIDFPGGTTRFTIRFDPVSQRYWTLCNYIPRKFRNAAYNAERFRGILALASSPNLNDWTVERIVMADGRLYSDDATVVASAFNGNQTRFGFQYADWQFDGADLVATVRTAFCDDYGDPAIGHNANYYLFRRVENFRVNAGPGAVRIRALDHAPATGTSLIACGTRPARLYHVEWSDDLHTWQDAGQSWEGTGEEATFAVTGQLANVRYYRVVETP